MIGVSVIPLPTWPDRVFLPSLSDCESLITPRTRAIVLISPNNPTGATYPPSLIESFALLAETHGIALILDETYRDFLLSSDGEQAVPHTLFQHSSPASTSKLEWRWRATLVHLFSFSKSYAIPGQRLGAIIASPDLLKQIATVLDCIQVRFQLQNSLSPRATYISPRGFNCHVYASLDLSTPCHPARALLKSSLVSSYILCLPDPNTTAIRHHLPPPTHPLCSPSREAAPRDLP